MIITIDGPAASGKSTVAKSLAKALGIMYFDTGALYRAVTWFVLESGIALDGDPCFSSALGSMDFRMEMKNEEKVYVVNGVDVTEAIRHPSVTRAVSQVAKSPAVREHLRIIQQDFAKRCDAVFEGRDLGSVVFPHADVKFFLFASPQERARRRCLELRQKGQDCEEERVLEELKRRDLQDSTRQLAPLKQPKDAICIDTTANSIQGVVDEMLACVKKVFP